VFSANETNDDEATAPLVDCRINDVTVLAAESHGKGSTLSRLLTTQWTKQQTVAALCLLLKTRNRFSIRKKLDFQIANSARKLFSQNTFIPKKTVSFIFVTLKRNTRGTLSEPPGECIPNFSGRQRCT